jgi:hypothetical protein
MILGGASEGTKVGLALFVEARNGGALHFKKVECGLDQDHRLYTQSPLTR